MSFFFQPKVQQGVLELDREESRHCVKVLRKQKGDRIKITDGKGYFYEASVSKADPKACGFEVINQEYVEPDPFHIHVALAPTKNLDRTEWFVEKAVEIGVHKISFILCDNSERKVLKTERLIRKAVSAMKQAQRSRLPQMHELISFQKLVQRQNAGYQLVAYLDDEPSKTLVEAVEPESDYLVLIGPEGDFSNAEIELARQQGFTTISLGNSRLRTETAGIAACHTLQLIQHGFTKSSQKTA